MEEGAQYLLENNFIDGPGNFIDNYKGIFRKVYIFNVIPIDISYTLYSKFLR